MKVLVVVCTYNPSGDYGKFKELRQAVLALQEDKVDILVCDNSANEEIKKEILGLGVNAHFIFERQPVQFCFNSALMNFPCMEYDYIVYSASDIIASNGGVIRLINDLQEVDGSVIHPQVTYDNTCWSHLSGFFDKSPTQVQIGQGINAHFVVHDRIFMEAYDYRRPDFLCGGKSEPFIAYMCAAIDRKEYSSHRVQFTHKGNMEFDHSTNGFYDRPYLGGWLDFTDKIRQAQFVGFEELYNPPEHDTIHHNKDLWKDGVPKELYGWCKDNLFIPKEYFEKVTTETICV